MVPWGAPQGRPKGVQNDPFLDPLLDPPGQKGPNNTGEMRHFWPGPAKRVKKGYPQNGSFWTPPGTPPERTLHLTYRNKPD
jgi:hypothetical protein